MSENILREILLEVHTIDYETSNDLPEYKPSLRHRIAMKRIFARFDRNMRKLRNTSTAAEMPVIKHKISIRGIKQRILTAALIIILMALLAGCVSAIVKFLSERFSGTVYEDNTQVFAVDLENCPRTIEYQYAFTDVPEGFELIETIPSPINIYTLYLNSSTGQTITLNQTVKTYFTMHYNTEKSKIEETKINDTTGLYMNFDTDRRSNSTFIWDNGDYIIEVSAELDKNAALDLLDITKL